MLTRPSLDELRVEIDEIDAKMHALLKRRAEIVESIAGVKAGGAEKPRLAMRPAREAALMRRLYDKHDGPFPFESILKMWRDIFTTNIARQGPFSVQVWGGGEALATFDEARYFYGARTPMELVDHPNGMPAHADAVEGAVCVALAKGGAAWWRGLIQSDAKICTRLPFAAAPSAPVIFAFARLENAPTGDDRSVFVLELKGDAALEGTVRKIVAAVGGMIEILDIDEAHGALIDVPGYIVSGSDEAAKLAEAVADAAEVHPIGAYAAQIPLTPKQG